MKSGHEAKPARWRVHAMAWAALLALVFAQVATGLHAQSAEPHDRSACVVCHLGDRHDDPAPPPAAFAFHAERVVAAPPPAAMSFPVSAAPEHAAARDPPLI